MVDRPRKRRLPTAKSRLLAGAGITCVFPMYWLYGWGGTWSTIIHPNIFGLVILAFLYAAKLTREREGQELIIPAGRERDFAVISSWQVSTALVGGASVIIAMIFVDLDFSITTKRVILVISLILILLSVVGNIVTNKIIRDKLN